MLVNLQKQSQVRHVITVCLQPYQSKTYILLQCKLVKLCTATVYYTHNSTVNWLHGYYVMHNISFDSKLEKFIVIAL